MFYDKIKKLTKNIPLLFKILRLFKDKLIILSRLKDVFIMMVLFHVWPEQMYRFSTRKFLPSKKNRFSKEFRPTIPYDLLINKSSNITKMKEINIISRGSSFDLNDIRKINEPIFLCAFWSPLKTNDNGKIIYNSDYSHKTGTYKNIEEHLKEESKTEDYKKKNITYVISRKNVLEMLKKREHDTLSIFNYYQNEFGNLCAFPITLANTVPEGIKGGRHEYISLKEKIYKPPLKNPFFYCAPSGSVLPIICALSHFAEKVNVYGWDFYLESSPESMSYWKLFFNLYKYKNDFASSKNHFESALVNFYYGYQLSKLPNINIHGYLGQLGKHGNFIKRIERALFQ